MRIAVPRALPSRGRFRVVVSYRADPDPEIRGTVEALFSLLMEAAAGGAFRTGAGPEPAWFVGATERWEEGPRETVFRVELRDVDPRFIECLRSGCEARAIAAGIESIVIDTEPGGADLATIAHPNGVEGRAIYPPLARLRLPFEDRFEEATRMHQIILAMNGPARPEQIAALAAHVAPWGALLEAGGFVLPRLDPELAASVMGPVQIFERDSIEIVIDRFDADREGLNALVNMIDTYSARVGEIRSAVLY